MADEFLTASPYNAYLNTNYSPSTTEVAAIQDFLTSPLEQLSELDEEVSRAQMWLNRLLTKQTELRTAVDLHQALLHPIRRIPKEVLQEIFMCCLPETHLPVLSTAQAPLLLTLVCKPWRELAFTTPMLWSALHIPIPHAQSEAAHLTVTSARNEAVRWWLRLSKDTPLSISLYWPPRIRDAWGTAARFPRTVIAYFDRIVNLELDLPTHLLQLIADQPAESVPVLQRIALYLKVSTGQNARGADVATGSIWVAPRLTSVVWHHVDDDLLRLPLNWSAMREIEVQGTGAVQDAYFSVRDARALLAACPRIASLSLQLMHYDGPRQPTRFPHDNDASVGATLTLPALRTLHLFDAMDDPMQPAFLRALQLPALRDLAYRIYSDYHRSCPLLAFLRAQFAPVLVQVFAIDTTSMLRDELVECLRLMPLLRRLTIVDPLPLGVLAYERVTELGLDDAFLVDLGGYPPRASPSPLPFANDEGYGCVCPRMEELRCTRATFSEQGLRAFVAARAAEVDGDRVAGGGGGALVKIQKLTVGLARFQPRDAQGRLVDLESELREQGVNAKITYMTPPPAPPPLKNPATDGLYPRDRIQWLYM